MSEVLSYVYFIFVMVGAAIMAFGGTLIGSTIVCAGLVLSLMNRYYDDKRLKCRVFFGTNYKKVLTINKGENLDDEENMRKKRDSDWEEEFENDILSPTKVGSFQRR